MSYSGFTKQRAWRICYPYTDGDSPPDSYNGLRLEYKPLVVDDIDRCFKLMCFPNVQIDACSLMTYDPSEVAFTPPTAPQEVQRDECVCDSLV